MCSNQLTIPNVCCWIMSVFLVVYIFHSWYVNIWFGRWPKKPCQYTFIFVPMQMVCACWHTAFCERKEPEGGNRVSCNVNCSYTIMSTTYCELIVDGSAGRLVSTPAFLLTEHFGSWHSKPISRILFIYSWCFVTIICFSHFPPKYPCYVSNALKLKSFRRFNDFSTDYFHKLLIDRAYLFVCWNTWNAIVFCFLFRACADRVRVPLAITKAFPLIAISNQQLEYPSDVGG